MYPSCKGLHIIDAEFKWLFCWSILFFRYNKCLGVASVLFQWSLLPRLWEQRIPRDREGDCWVEQATVLSNTPSYTPVALSAILTVFGRLRKVRFISYICRTLKKIRSCPVCYLLTPWSRDLLEKLTASQIVKIFLAFYGTRRFITAFTSARHLSLSWASSIQPKPPYPSSWRSILILSSHLRRGLPSGLFPSGFPTKTMYTSFVSPIPATCPAHLSFVTRITKTILRTKFVYL